MNKLFITTISLAMPFFALAEDKPLTNYSIYTRLDCDTIPACIELLVNAAVKLALPIAVIFIIWSGFLFVWARGSEESVKKARATLTWSIIGLAVTIAAWTLAVAFKNFFTGL